MILKRVCPVCGNIKEKYEAAEKCYFAFLSIDCLFDSKFSIHPSICFSPSIPILSFLMIFDLLIYIYLGKRVSTDADKEQAAIAFTEEIQRSTVVYEFFNYTFLHPAFFGCSNETNCQQLVKFFDYFYEITNDTDSDMGRKISENEFASVLSNPALFPATVDIELMAEFLHYYNNTVTYQEEEIFDEDQVNYNKYFNV